MAAGALPSSSYGRDKRWGSGGDMIRTIMPPSPPPGTTMPWIKPPVSYGQPGAPAPALPIGALPSPAAPLPSPYAQRYAQATGQPSGGFDPSQFGYDPGRQMPQFRVPTVPAQQTRLPYQAPMGALPSPYRNTRNMRLR